MKALFITTNTSDCANHVRAWNSFEPVPAYHLKYDLNITGVVRRPECTLVAKEVSPDVIFYIGAYSNPNNPRPGDLRELRDYAPVVLICSDAQDTEWHSVLDDFKKRNSIDLSVAIDGALNSPADMTTLTPVDPTPFSGIRENDIRCGFSGTVVGRDNRRASLMRFLEETGDLIVRRRWPREGYDDHAQFLLRCRMLLNVSVTGSERDNHIKGRVLEAGWAGCALLENIESPIANWFPQGSWLSYIDPPDAARVIAETSDTEIADVAGKLSEHVRSHYRPEMIYGGILRELGLTKQGTSPKLEAAD